LKVGKRHGLCARFLKMRRLPKILLAVILLPLLAEAAPLPRVLSVLFVGNSLTEANDLPTVLKKFAADSSQRVEIDVRSITPGGALFYDHWRKGEALTLLRQQHPNVLILQGQSTEPLSASQNFIYYAGLFKAEADRVHATTVLLSTWARPAGDRYYKDPTSGGSPAEMQTRLNAAYASLARNLGATLAPVGLAWERARHEAPGIELLDGTQHPSRAGTYLAAAVLFRAVCSPSPVSSTYYGGLPKETALSLQHAANAAPLTPTP
jgi:hypothetical protein